MKSILTFKSKWALTGVVGDGIMARAPISTGTRYAVIDVDLATGTGESNGTSTFKRVDEIMARSTVQAWPVLALVDVNLALGSGES